MLIQTRLNFKALFQILISQKMTVLFITIEAKTTRRYPIIQSVIVNLQLLSLRGLIMILYVVYIVIPRFLHLAKKWLSSVMSTVKLLSILLSINLQSLPILQAIMSKLKYKLKNSLKKIGRKYVSLDLAQSLFKKKICLFFNHTGTLSVY